MDVSAGIAGAKSPTHCRSLSARLKSGPDTKPSSFCFPSGQPQCLGFALSFSSHVRWGERGAPLWIGGTRIGLRGRPAVSHISRKTSEVPRISCTQLWKEPLVRLSSRKGAGSAGNPRNYTGNRGCGAPGFCGGDREKVSFGSLASLPAELPAHSDPSFPGRGLAC
jgi:hypothetical protein